jgi:parvulin-like peptidyl-prolyl isomerase
LLLLIYPNSHNITALKHFYLIILTLFVTFSLQSQLSSNQKSIIGRAGDIFISEYEFLSRYELLPAPQRSASRSVEESKLALMYSLIAEKLLVQEALSRGFDKDSTFLRSTLSLRKLLARDQLYKVEIINKVEVTNKEIAIGMAQYQQERLVSYIFTPEKESAEFIRSRIKSAKDFNSIDLDTSLNAIRDTATIIWGAADESIEKVTYQLKSEEVSPIVAAGDGLYIIKVSRIRRNTSIVLQGRNVVREYVIKTIRARKEQKRLNEYVSNFLQGKTGYSRAHQFRRLIQSLEIVFKEQRQIGKISLSADMVKKTKYLLKEILFDTLVVAGEAIWTMNDIIDKLYISSFSIELSKLNDIALTLNRTIEIWVWQELLGQEGLRRKMDQEPAVQNLLQMWYEQNLSEAMKNYISKTNPPTEGEIWVYLNSKNPEFSVPRVKIREIWTQHKDTLYFILKRLAQGEEFGSLAFEYAFDEEGKKRKGISDFFQINERYPLGEIAFRMNIGEMSHTIQYKNGYEIFQLIEKEIDKKVTDSLYSLYENEIIQMKKRRTTNLFLAQIAKRRNYSIFYDRLQALKVTTIPMMTYRLLGFGGRMFAVPPISRMVDWISIEAPSGIIVP